MLLAAPASRTVTLKFLLFVNDLVLLSLQQQRADLIGGSHTMLVALPFFVPAQWGCHSTAEVLGCKEEEVMLVLTTGTLLRCLLGEKQGSGILSHLIHSELHQGRDLSVCVSPALFIRASHGLSLVVHQQREKCFIYVYIHTFHKYICIVFCQ